MQGSAKSVGFELNFKPYIRSTEEGTGVHRWLPATGPPQPTLLHTETSLLAADMLATDIGSGMNGPTEQSRGKHGIKQIRLLTCQSPHCCLNISWGSRTVVARDRWGLALIPALRQSACRNWQCANRFDNGLRVEILVEHPVHLPEPCAVKGRVE